MWRVVSEVDGGSSVWSKWGEWCLEMMGIVMPGVDGVVVSGVNGKSGVWR